eukprot:10976986-Alexandrium_andersonii.AAC.1
MGCAQPIALSKTESIAHPVLIPSPSSASVTRRDETGWHWALYASVRMCACACSCAPVRECAPCVRLCVRVCACV